MLLVLTAVAAGNSAYQMASEASVAQAYQREAEEAFRNQPARHPHRVVHYGHYVFRTPTPLAAVDPGVDAFTGRSIFLEGHRRNTATFAEARETSVLTRLGAVSPAFMLQVIAPLLLILVGFNSVVRERERGTWMQLLALGVRPGQLILGKALAIAGVAALVLTPLLVAVLWLGSRHPGEMLPGLVMLGGHALYLLCWVLLIVAVSAAIRHSRSALIGLMVVWAGTTVLMPRIAADVAATVAPSWTQTEMDILVQRDMRIVGDSHNINDPGFQSFQERVLAQYGVDRIEDLPVNYRGLVSYQGEAEGSAVKNRYAAELHAVQRRQAEVIRVVLAAEPVRRRPQPVDANGRDGPGQPPALPGCCGGPPVRADPGAEPAARARAAVRGRRGAQRGFRGGVAYPDQPRVLAAPQQLLLRPVPGGRADRVRPAAPVRARRLGRGVGRGPAVRRRQGR
jgi:ABC-2 type transport system permease protein